MHDLVIRGGTVVDGTGRTGLPRRRRRRRRRDHRGRQRRRGGPRARSTPTACSSRPGFVDVHTHYDGQVTWDPLLTPSSWHGVTTVVMGNCGVGFAPGAARQARVAHRADGGRRGHPRHRARPRASRWGWETFPEYLDFARPPAARDRRRHAGAARRGARLRDGRARRAERARDTRRHRGDGAHRARGHRGRRARRSRRRARSRTGPSTASPCPARSPPRTSCSRSGARSAQRRHGVFELAPAGVDGRGPRRARARRWTGCAGCRPATGRPGHVRAASSTTSTPDQWREDARPRGTRGRRARGSDPAAGRGPPARPAARAPDRSTRCASRRRYQRPRHDLPLDEQVAALRDPERAGAHPRRAARRPTTASPACGVGLDRIFRLGDPPDYEPAPDREHRRARPPREGRDPRELALRPAARGRRPRAAAVPLLGYSHQHPRPDPRDAAAPRARVSASATAARTCGAICDAASRPTCSRTGCATAPAASACRSSSWCKKLTSDTASLYGLDDRGALAPGQEGRPQRHRPRPAHAPPARDRLRPAGRRGRGCSSRPTATSPRS